MIPPDPVMPLWRSSPHPGIQTMSRYVPQDEVNRLVNVATASGAEQLIFSVDRDLHKPNLVTLCK